VRAGDPHVVGNPGAGGGDPGEEAPADGEGCAGPVGEAAARRADAQQMILDRSGCAGCSPIWSGSGRRGSRQTQTARGGIDASVFLVYGLLPEAAAGVVLHAPTAQRPTPGGAASVYTRRSAKAGNPSTARSILHVSDWPGGSERCSRVGVALFANHIWVYPPRAGESCTDQICTEQAHTSQVRMTQISTG
jgi:hypothetical protein